MKLGAVRVLAGFSILCAVASVQGDWKTTEDRTVVVVRDAEVAQPIDGGKWCLRGTLELPFEGRIVPHENSMLNVFGPGVEAIEGRFEKVEAPQGWLYDLEYGPKSVTVKNLRPDHVPAFPGAEGFGKYTVGGRGGRVYIVDNLNDSGPGSFREACEAQGPRTVVFAVSGTITLESDLKVKNPYITIAGQTAPGDGICLRKFPFTFKADQVIVRYMRFRPGDIAEKELDAFAGEGDHVIVDHCTASWCIDECLSINKASNVTVQWCLVSESLTRSIHKKGSHGHGGLWGGPGGSYHHNILAHHTSRNPRASGNENSGLLDYRNNVVFNWGFNSAYGGELWPRNWINNYYKYGPATKGNVRDRIFLQKDPRGKMYADGNYVWGFPEIGKDNWNGGIDFSSDGEATEATLRVRAPYVVAPVRTQSAEEAYQLALKNAGCSLVRDSVDARIIDEIRSGTATYGKSYEGGGKGIIDSQDDVGGWPALNSKPAPPDADRDGMPDAWERGHGLDPAHSTDSASDADGNGYTNAEDYLNSLVPAIYVDSTK